MGHIGQAWAEDVSIRPGGLEPRDANPDAFRSMVHEVEPGIVYQDDLVTVRAIAMPHGSWEHAYAYRFGGPDRTNVISGDTGPTDVLAEACAGCGIPLHEVYDLEGFGVRPPE